MILTDHAAVIQRLRNLFRDQADTNTWQLVGDGLYRTVMRWPDRHLYVLVDGDRYAAAPATAEPLPGLQAEMRRCLQAEIEHQRLPTCVVPGCDEKAPYVFKAAERGRLAGRGWVPGEEIRTCPEHGQDIHRAQGAYGRDELAEWLRPDAKLDPLDAYDASYDTLNGYRIQDDRARMLRVKVPAKEDRPTP